MSFHVKCYLCHLPLQLCANGASKAHVKTLNCEGMKGKRIHGVYSGCGYGKRVLGSVLMRGAPNEKHRAPSNLLA